MKNNVFGYDFPPGCEFHPNAPYNQVESPDYDHIRDCLKMVGELEEMIQAEDALNDCLKTCRNLYDEIYRVLREDEP